MRVVYFGSSDFAVPTLMAVANSVVHVVTQPAKPVGRKKVLTQTPVALAAQKLGLSVSAPVRARDAVFVEFVAGLEPDMLLVAAYGQILSEDLLHTAKRGGINLHASLLPRYRGAAPIGRAILCGESETGITLMQMDRGMDTGDIIAAESMPIGPDETAGELEMRLAELAATMSIVWLPRICAGDYPRTSQNESEATYAHKMHRSDGEVAIDSSAEQAYRKFRACTPKPGAYMRTRFGELRLLRARLGPAESQPPGTIQSLGPTEFSVSMGSGCLTLAEVVPQGKSKMTAAAWAHGHRLKTGDIIA